MIKKNSYTAEVGDIWDKIWSRERVQRTDRLESDNWSKCHRPFIDRELRQLDKQKKFLEAGCGMGQWVFYAANLGIPSYGVDIARTTINNLQSYVNNRDIQNCHFIYDNLCNSNLPSNNFDFIISLGVIEHFKNSQPMLRELKRILRPSGKVLITVPNKWSFHSISRPLLRLIKKWQLGYEKSFSPSELAKEVNKAGFEVIEKGVIPSGELFGLWPLLIPFIGKFLFKLIEKISYFIEKRQEVIGFIAYVIVTKKG